MALPKTHHRTPTVIIAGAPRCGTTSLFNWLAEHPLVCSAKEKETYFLMDPGATVPLGPRYYDEGIEGYSRFFPLQTSSRPVLLEATPGYMYQRTALKVLADEIQDVKLIFVLRKPSERVLSCYHYFSNNWLDIDPRQLSFAAYLKLANQEAPSLAHSQFLRYAIRHGRYADYLIRWRDRCGPERIKILLLEELRAKPEALLRDLAEWLGIAPEFFDDFVFRRHNENYRVRNYSLQRFNLLARRVLPRGPLWDWLRRAYRRTNIRRSPRPTAEENALLTDLDEIYADANNKLRNNFGLDLTSWTTVRDEGTTVARS